MADIDVQDQNLDDQQVPAVDPGLNLPPLPPRPRAHLPPLQFLRTPPILKSEMNLQLYLLRFTSYCESIGAQPNEMVNILINCLSDDCLLAVERHITPRTTYEELLEILRRELGESQENKEEYRAQLKKTVRGRNENVRKYYIKLYNICKKAYPGAQQIVKDTALRDAFINGIGDAQISARLREDPDATNEQVLTRANLLLNCKNSSTNRHNQIVNAAFNQSDQKKINQLEAQMKTLIDLITANVIKQNEGVSNTAEAPTYDFQDPRTSIALPQEPSNKI